MHFQAKNIFKSNCRHTPKHTFNYYSFDCCLFYLFIFNWFFLFYHSILDWLGIIFHNFLFIYSVQYNLNLTTHE